MRDQTMCSKNASYDEYSHWRQCSLTQRRVTGPHSGARVCVKECVRNYDELNDIVSV